MHPRVGFAVALLLEQHPSYREHALLAAFQAMDDVLELTRAQSLIHAIVDVVSQQGIEGEELAALTPGACSLMRWVAGATCSDGLWFYRRI